MSSLAMSIFFSLFSASVCKESSSKEGAKPKASLKSGSEGVPKILVFSSFAMQ
jgi:hypothetical protein